MPAKIPYNAEIAQKILEYLSEGISLLKICNRQGEYWEPGIPSQAVIRKWALENKEFAKEYLVARQLYADTLAEQVHEIAEDSGNDYIIDEKTGKPKFKGDHVSRAKLRIDAIKWTAKNWHPRRYNDRLVHVTKDKKGNEIGFNIMVPVTKTEE